MFGSVAVFENGEREIVEIGMKSQRKEIGGKKTDVWIGICIRRRGGRIRR